MLLPLLLALLTGTPVPAAAPALSAPAATLSAPAPVVATLDDEADRKEEWKKKKEEAGEDAEKLWDLYLWCDAYGMKNEGRKTLLALVRVDENHKEARELLGHVYYDGQWFKSQKAADRYKEKEEKRRAEEEGLVKYKDEWVKKEDLPYLKKGFVKNDEGEWIDAEQAKRIAEGWRQQDLEWIAPADFDKLDKGLWKCGDKWLTLEEANEYHKSTEYPWVIPTDHFILYTTCTRELADKIAKTIERAYRDMAKIYGGAPPDKAPIVVFRTHQQYNSFAAGNQMTGRPATDALGFSSVHHAYFADTWIKDEVFMGAGVGYWDQDAENGNSWGPHSVRHAAGLAIAEAMDPSADARDEIESKGLSDSRLGKFYQQKRVPLWFRIGAASYVERYFIDNLVGSGGDPEWARKWSIQNLVSKGGLRPVGDLFEIQLSTDNAEKVFNEFGLLMAFILDGKCAPVVEAHGLVKKQLREGSDKDVEKAFESLQKALIANQTEIRKFAGV